MGNLTYSQVTKNLFTAVLVSAGCSIVAGLCGLFWLVPAFAIIALIFNLGTIGANIWFFISLGNWKTVVDSNDVPAVQKLWIGTLLSIIAGVVGLIPIIGTYLGALVAIAGFVFYVMGAGELKISTTLPANGVEGAKKLHTACILSLIAAVLLIIPFINILGGIISIVACVLQILAWKKIATA